MWKNTNAFSLCRLELNENHSIRIINFFLSSWKSLFLSVLLGSSLGLMNWHFLVGYRVEYSPPIDFSLYDQTSWVEIQSQLPAVAARTMQKKGLSKEELNLLQLMSKSGWWKKNVSFNQGALIFNSTGRSREAAYQESKFVVYFLYNAITNFGAQSILRAYLKLNAEAISVIRGQIILLDGDLYKSKRLKRVLLDMEQNFRGSNNPVSNYVVGNDVQIAKLQVDREVLGNKLESLIEVDRMLLDINQILAKDADQMDSPETLLRSMRTSMGLGFTHSLKGGELLNQLDRLMVGLKFRADMHPSIIYRASSIYKNIFGGAIAGFLIMIIVLFRMPLINISKNIKFK